VLPLAAILASWLVLGVGQIEAQENVRLRSDAMRVLVCVTQPDAPVHLSAEYSGADRFRVQYRYFTEHLYLGDGKYENKQDLGLLVYRKDGRTAYLFNVWMKALDDPKRLQLWNALYLEKPKQQWEVIELWQGGMGVLTEEQKSLQAILKSPLRTVLRSTLPSATGPCWVPAPTVGRYGIRLGSPGTAF
jgi:hypothetical protein